MTRLERTEEEVVAALEHTDVDEASEQARNEVWERIQQVAQVMRERIASDTYERMRNLLLYGEHPPSEAALEAASRIYDTDTVRVRLTNNTTGEYSEVDLYDQLNTWDGIEVKLDRCWKCEKPVPKDDDFGLCVSCKEALLNLVEGGDGLTDQPTEASSHGDEPHGTEVRNDSEVQGFTVDWRIDDELHHIAYWDSTS